MGGGMSAHEMEQAARRRSKTIDDGLQAERMKEARTVRVLMLGLRGAGKSTLAKQVRMIHEKGFADKEKAVYREVVRQNVACAVVGVLSEMEDHGVDFGTEELRKTARSVKDRLKLPDSHKALPDMRHTLALLTSQKVLRDFMDSKMDVETCQLSHYLFRSLDRIMADTYSPSDYDILRVRQKTGGLSEILFNFKGFEFRLCDVDGQGIVKKKWLQNFENVSAIIFTVALSSYDIKSKDHEKTEIHDALSVFKTVAGHSGFSRSPIVLFLNKKDIFQQKLKRVPLTVAFPDYRGTNDFADACQFVQGKFESCLTHSPDRLNVNITNATDTPSIRSVFDSSLAVILEQA